MHLFRHIAPKSLDRRQPACVFFVLPDEKSDYAIPHSELCGITLSLSDADAARQKALLIQFNPTTADIQELKRDYDLFYFHKNPQ